MDLPRLSERGLLPNKVGVVGFVPNRYSQFIDGQIVGHWPIL